MGVRVRVLVHGRVHTRTRAMFGKKTIHGYWASYVHIFVPGSHGPQDSLFFSFLIDKRNMEEYCKFLSRMACAYICTFIHTCIYTYVYM